MMDLTRIKTKTFIFTRNLFCKEICYYDVMPRLDSGMSHSCNTGLHFEMRDGKWSPARSSFSETAAKNVETAFTRLVATETAA